MLAGFQMEMVDTPVQKEFMRLICSERLMWNPKKKQTITKR